MTESPARPLLRERQAELVRAAILDALAARLEHEAPDDVTVDELARRQTAVPPARRLVGRTAVSAHR